MPTHYPHEFLLFYFLTLTAITSNSYTVVLKSDGLQTVYFTISLVVLDVIISCNVVTT